MPFSEPLNKHDFLLRHQELVKILDESWDAFPSSEVFVNPSNNKIKVIKRMAYGYRDNDYFFLKIKAAFPGKLR